MKREIVVIQANDMDNMLCKFPGNRDAKENRTLTASIEGFGRTFNPVLIGKKIESSEGVDGSVLPVDKYYPVLDGQHRVLSLRKLGLPIVCVLDETIDYEKDLKALSALQKAKAWSIDNFISFLSNYDDPVAIQLEQLIAEYDQFTSTQVAETFYDGFTKGSKGLIEKEEYAINEEIGRWVLDAAIELGFNATTILRALKYLHSKNGEFSIKRLKDRLMETEIEWSANEVEVIEQILPVYNAGLYEDEMISYEAPKKNRWFGNDVKLKAMARAGGQCEYSNPEDGIRCEETTNLEYDHDLPYKYGGANTLENCRILCRTHNRSKGAK